MKRRGSRGELPAGPDPVAIERWGAVQGWHGPDLRVRQMSDRNTAEFRATAGTLQGFGKTPQAALAALMQRLPDAAAVPIVIWPYNRGDTFFTAEQQTRLQELMQRQAVLTAEERAEL